MIDEFDDEDLDLEGSSFDEFDEQEKTTLGDLWRNNSMVKFGVIGLVAVAVLGLVIGFGEQEGPADMSVVSTGSDVRGTPGAEEASPAYIEAVEEKNQERIEQAQRQGTSALPTPVTPPVGRLDLPTEEVEQEDPLQRWRQIQEERLQRELEQTRIVEGPIVDEVNDQTEAIQQMAELMSEQMQAILEAQNVEPSIRSAQITSPNYLDNLREQELANAQPVSSNNMTEDGGLASTGGGLGKLILPAGEILYGQLLTEANSDSPGSVVAQVFSGPFRGSRVIGNVQANIQQQIITLNFQTLVYNNRSYQINAVAVDPNTTSNAVQTDVDQRWFRRVIFPAAAAFFEGAASAIANTGLTTITVEGDTVAEQTEEADNEQQIASGIEEAGQELGRILQQIGQQTLPVIRVEAGTPLGIVFLNEVREENLSPQINDAESQVQ